MTDQKPVHHKPTSPDEIDLGQLFHIIGRGFSAVFRGILRLFIYLKNNFIILAALVFIGFAIGYALKFVISDELKAEVIVKPNFDSKDYLYDVIEEINANLSVRDTVFFDEIGIVISELKNLQIKIEPIVRAGISEDNLESDLKYLGALQNFKDDPFVQDVVKAEIQKKSSINHRITFLYKNNLPGRAATLRLMDYIQGNTYFNSLKEVYNSNAKTKIQRNTELVEQIDSLVSGYAKNIANQTALQAGTFLMDNQNGLDITSLLSLKNTLVKEIEQKNLEIEEQQDIINIINFGKSQKVRTPIYAQGIAVIPALFLLFFFLYSILKYLNQKADELER